VIAKAMHVAFLSNSSVCHRRALCKPKMSGAVRKKQNLHQNKWS